MKILNKVICRAFIAALMPVLFMLYLYNNNYRYIYFRHVTITIAVLACVSVLTFLLISLVFKNNTGGLNGALVYCALFWIFFILYGVFYNNIFARELSHSVLLPCYVGVLILSFILIWHCGKKHVLRLPVVFLGVVIILLTLVNGLETFRLHYISKYQDIDENGKAEVSVIKSKFNMNKALPSPNVYWIHCDGMLGFDAMEAYFAEPQTEFKKELESCGFVINESAAFFAEHSTEIAIPVLMSPGYYDARLYQQLYQSAVGDHTNPYNFDELLQVRKENELIRSFEQKGYESVIIADIDRYYPPVSDIIYACHEEVGTYKFDKEDLPQDSLEWMQDFESKRQLIELLRQVSPFAVVYDRIVMAMWDELANTYNGKEVQVPNDVYDDMQQPNVKVEAMKSALREIFKTDQPKIVIMHSFLAHAPFYYDENGVCKVRGSDEIMRYPAQHKYAAKILMEYVDMIQAADPEAIIVLQSDHGLHQQSPKNILQAFPSDQEGDMQAVIDLWNSTMSAVYLPEGYGDITEPILPVNIARVLINNFVGENYSYCNGELSDLF